MLACKLPQLITESITEGTGWVHLELAGTAEPEVVFPRELRHSVAGLVDSDAAVVTADQLVRIKVHIAVTHSAAITRPTHLRSSALVILKKTLRGSVEARIDPIHIVWDARSKQDVRKTLCHACISRTLCKPYGSAMVTAAE